MRWNTVGRVLLVVSPHSEGGMLETTAAGAAGAAGAAAAAAAAPAAASAMTSGWCVGVATAMTLVFYELRAYTTATVCLRSTCLPQ